jgi:hypothetical protein
MSDLRSTLAPAIDDLWERRAELSPADSAARAEVVAAVDKIDARTSTFRAGSGSRTTHVIDVETGDELTPGEAPAWSVCVGGTRMRKFAGGEYGLPCLLMLRRLAAGSRHDKTELNAILRDHGVNG